MRSTVTLSKPDPAAHSSSAWVPWNASTSGGTPRMAGCLRLGALCRDLYHGRNSSNMMPYPLRHGPPGPATSPCKQHGSQHGPPCNTGRPEGFDTGRLSPLIRWASSTRVRRRRLCVCMCICLTGSAGCGCVAEHCLRCTHSTQWRVCARLEIAWPGSWLPVIDLPSNPCPTIIAPCRNPTVNQHSSLPPIHSLSGSLTLSLARPTAVEKNRHEAGQAVWQTHGLCGW